MKNKLKDLFFSSKYIIALTGAGISTLSGIRDFRGKNGIYNDFDADKIFDLNYFYKEPEFYYKSVKEFIYGIEKFKPNIIHKLLAALEKKKIIQALITQNVDMLHSLAGSKNIIELHGSPRIHYCLDCGNQFEFKEIVKIVEKDEIPKCSCGGIVKPDIVFFGENLHKEALEAADREIKFADLMLVLGSSLSVHPAAYFPEVFVRSGGKLIIVNDQPTYMDKSCILKYDDLEIFAKDLNCFIDKLN
jgi:NAD-dependent deacetylase